eukprot:7981505-Alexandrium_andersonii.AAC.1
MSASLVGSEMCIRDSFGGVDFQKPPPHAADQRTLTPSEARPAGKGSVSYTHLTLPTICSV